MSWCDSHRCPLMRKDSVSCLSTASSENSHHVRLIRSDFMTVLYSSPEMASIKENVEEHAEEPIVEPAVKYKAVAKRW